MGWDEQTYKTEISREVRSYYEGLPDEVFEFNITDVKTFQMFMRLSKKIGSFTKEKEFECFVSGKDDLSINPTFQICFYPKKADK